MEEQQLKKSLDILMKLSTEKHTVFKQFTQLDYETIMQKNDMEDIDVSVDKCTLDCKGR